MSEVLSFCSACGSKVKPQILEHEDRPRPVCISCGKVHYQNPNIVTGVVCFHQSKVLLCQRAIPPRKDCWTLPSGYMELNETLEEGALREAREEAGIKPHSLSLLAIYSLPHISQVQVLFLGELDSFETEAGVESLAVEFFDWADIPWSELAFPSNQRALHHAWKMKDAPCVIPDTFSGFTPIDSHLL